MAEDLIISNFQLTTDKQDDVELLSNWIMHYKDKATIELIVDGWLQAFRNGQFENPAYSRPSGHRVYKPF